MSAATKEAGLMAMPGPLDVCKVPAPPGSPIPMPFPNMASPPTASPVSEKVFFNGMAALTKKSVIPMTDGDQAGTAGGVQSGKIMGPGKFTTGSTKVEIDGNPAIHLGATTTQNDGNGVGAYTTPSQAVVVINE